MVRALVTVAWLLACGSAVLAQAPAGATVREYRKAIRTYPFSDPNPIAAPGRIYPYYRFDGYTDTPVNREWTVVELENAYLRVTVLPEIGGKIWSAVEKSTGRSFIYDNHVVKFRDISLRGPWTSGGIEPNYGIIGHTPNCATPVDYVTHTGPQGASIVIGVLDLLTRTPWRLEITLPHDKAYFTTRSLWHNATPVEQPHYTWMNAGIRAAGNLELVYPGTHYIGHGGEVFPWPVHPANGKNLAFYEQNDFGSYKSYHVLGRHTDFFGAYWHDDEFGMARYSPRDDKLGKKAWIWGLSRQGMIWEPLLTDTDGQYVEVQSGRLFNQSAESSTLTPFKHAGFAPYATDTWTEYWFPVKGTGGFVQANEHGALNVTNDGGRVTVRFSPLERVDDTLDVFDGERRIASVPLRLSPMQTWSRTFDAAVPRDRLRVRIGGRLEFRADADDRLSRPLASPPDFDWESVQGLHLRGKEWMRQRDDAQAQAALEACLKKDPNYLPALADLAMVRYRAMDYQRAWELSRRALSIDTYDPAGNYYYGLASLRLGKMADAADGFEVAALSPAYRVAAWTELARLCLREGRVEKAGLYAERALTATPTDGQQASEAFQLSLVIARLAGRRSGVPPPAPLDPLAHLARFERYLQVGDEASRRRFVEAIRGEMPHETYLELAAWYLGIGREEDARRLLGLAAEPNAEMLYWQAYLQSRAEAQAGAPSDSSVAPQSGMVPHSGVAQSSSFALLARADAASPRLVFPFRSESASVLEWAVRESASWKPKYFLALILWSRNDLARARDLLAQCGSTPDFAPFYATRAKAFEAVSRERAMEDLLQAARRDPREWRFGKLVAERHLEDGRWDEALAVAARYHQQAPENYIIGMLWAKALLRASRHEEAATALRALRVLPYEGATEGRSLYREAQLMLGARAWKSGRTAEAAARVAAAREWPENLGAGKPYAADVDERLEGWLEAVCHRDALASADPRILLHRAPTAEEQRILAAWR